MALTLAAFACGDKPGSSDTTGTTSASTSTGTSSTSAGSTSEDTSSTGSSTGESTSSGAGESTSSSTGDTGGATGGADGVCEDKHLHYDPWLDPLGPGSEPCDPVEQAEACATADDLPGYRQCLGFEIVEDMTEFSWGPCMPSCEAGDAESSAACGEGDVGVRYCGDLSLGGETVYVWYPCLEAVCVRCEPGDTRLCDPDTPYPDTVIPCGLSGGVPVWHDGDCYT